MTTESPCAKSKQKGTAVNVNTKTKVVQKVRSRTLIMAYEFQYNNDISEFFDYVDKVSEGESTIDSSTLHFDIFDAGDES